MKTTQVNKLVNDLKPGKGKAGEMQRKANSVFARDKSHTEKLTLGGIGAGISGAFAGFGQVPQAHGEVGDSVSFNVRKGGVMQVQTGKEMFNIPGFDFGHDPNTPNPSITKTRKPSGVTYNALISNSDPNKFNPKNKTEIGLGGIDYMIKNMNITPPKKSTDTKLKSTPKNRNLLAEQNARTKELDYNLLTGAPKTGESKSKNNIIGNQTNGKQPQPIPNNGGLTYTVTKGVYKQQPIFDKFGQRDFRAEQIAMSKATAVGAGGKSTQKQTSKIKLTNAQKQQIVKANAQQAKLDRMKIKTSKFDVFSREAFNQNPVLNSSFDKKIKTSYGVGVTKTSNQNNPYEELGNFSNPFFGKVKPYGKQK